MFRRRVDFLRIAGQPTVSEQPPVPPNAGNIHGSVSWPLSGVPDTRVASALHVSLTQADTPCVRQWPISYALISGFRRGVDEICALLGYYTT
jgi:hypothetical protein